MRFIQTDGWDEGTEAVRTRLESELKQGKRVVWLVTGGSNLKTAVQVMEGLPHDETERLTIFLTDERYGEVGHNDSNAKQLHDAGFQSHEAIFIPTLEPGFTLHETQERYAQAVGRAFEHADVIIAQFGLGTDGHIAGILPHSPAVNASELVAAYQSNPFTRVTLAFPAIRQVSAAYMQAFGEDKHDQLRRLHDEALSLDEQPSQILKELPEAYIYNDLMGDNA